MIRIGSFCSGIGALDLAAMAVFGGQVVWHAENDPDANKVLAHHWPNVPNYGDITSTDWSRTEPVDILTAGFPCQPVSQAGRRKGTADDRWLWDSIASAVSRMDSRPRMLLLENVPGLLTANGGDAVGRVVHSLANLGYVGRWRLLRASDVGACHRRERWFCVAWLATDSDGQRIDWGRQPGSGGGPEPADSAVADPERGTGSRHRNAIPGDSADATRSGQAVSGRCGGAATHPGRPGLEDGHIQHHGPQRSAAERGGVSTPTYPNGGSSRSEHDGQADRPEGHDLHDQHDLDGLGVDFGGYTLAIRRWERVLGRPAPTPTERGRNGQPRLAPPFVEWMMGLPDGWVTAVPGISRNAMLRLLGNGVVWQQGAAAYASLVPTVAAEDTETTTTRTA